MAKSGDFLVMKQSSQRTLGLVPICSYKYSFDADSFSCLPCERGLKSYGLQEDECISCMRAWPGLVWVYPCTRSVDTTEKRTSNVVCGFAQSARGAKWRDVLV